MELKKVMQRELLGTAALQQYDLIFTKIQNSQGILLKPRFNKSFIQLPIILIRGLKDMKFSPITLLG